jgi:hypothetical protein
VGGRQEGGELYPWAARVGLEVAGGGSPEWSRTRSSAPARGQRHACGSSAAFGCRHVLVVLLWRVVARRAAAGGVTTAAAARAAVAPEKNGGRARRKKERERREKRESTGL